MVQGKHKVTEKEGSNRKRKLKNQGCVRETRKKGRT